MFVEVLPRELIEKHDVRNPHVLGFKVQSLDVAVVFWIPKRELVDPEQKMFPINDNLCSEIFTLN